jgi:hypothetical protein
MSQQPNSNDQHWTTYGNRHLSVEENAANTLNSPFVQMLEEAYGGQQKVGNNAQDRHSGYDGSASTHQPDNNTASIPAPQTPAVTSGPTKMISGSATYYEAGFDGKVYYSFDGQRWDLSQRQNNIANCPLVIYANLINAGSQAAGSGSSVSAGGDSSSYNRGAGGSSYSNARSHYTSD